MGDGWAPALKTGLRMRGVVGFSSAGGGLAGAGASGIKKRRQLRLQKVALTINRRYRTWCSCRLTSSQEQLIIPTEQEQALPHDKRPHRRAVFRVIVNRRSLRFSPRRV